MTQQNILTGMIIVIVALIIVAAGILVVLAPAGTGPAPGTALSVPEAPTPDQMKSLAAEIAGRIDGDALAALKPGDENTPAYTAVHDQLNAIRASNPNILYIYTVRKTGDGAEYIVDADYGIGDGAQIGYVCNLTDADVAFLAGFAGPSAEPGFYVDEWGDIIYTAISGYAPVKDSRGAIVGMLGVDVGRVITEESLKALAADAAARIDGDALAALKPGDENTPAYTAVHDRLRAFRDANPGVLYVYTMRKAGNATEYVVDADYGSSTHAARIAAGIGKVYYPTEEDALFLAGFTEPSAEREIYTAEWGDVTATVISGYAPVRDSNGTIVGLVGVDIGSEKMIAKTATAQKVFTPDETKALAAKIAGQIDGDAHAALKPGDENTPAYIAIRDRLDAFRNANPGVVYVYTMRNVGNVTEYVVDADYGSGSYAFVIGDDYTPAREDTALLAGFTQPASGTYTTVYGFAPIKNSGGAVTGVVCLYVNSPIAQEDLEALAAEIAGQIDGDALAALKPGDEKTPAFTAIRDRLDAFRTVNPEIVYIYTMRKAGSVTEYVVDADYGSDDYAPAIGIEYIPQDSDTAFLDGFTKPSAAIYIAISGYAPIKGATGAVVGLVGVDTESLVTQERVKTLAAEIAGQIDGDALAALKPGDEKTPAFTAIRDRLDAFRDANAGVIYVYTLRRVGETVEYVVDADYGSADTPGIGEVCNDTGAAMLAGFTEASAESAFITEQWGNETATILSGYAPVRDSTGAVVGLVGVDMGILW